MDTVASLRSVVLCAADLQCLQTVAVPRNGGDILVLCSIIVVTLTIPQIRRSIGAAVQEHWPAALLLLVASIAYIYNAHPVPFALCILAVVTYAVLRSGLFRGAGRRPTAFVRAPFWDLPHKVLVAGAATFAVATAAHHIHDRLQYTSRLQQAPTVLVAFTLPGETNPPLTTGTQTEADALSKRMWHYLRSVFRDLNQKVIILPADETEPDFAKLRKVFPPEHHSRDTLAQNLLQHGKHTGHLIDVAIGTKLTVISVHRRQVESLFKLFQLQPPTDRHGRAALHPAKRVRLRVRDDDLDRAALIAATRLSLIFATQLDYLSDKDKSALWAALNDQFRSFHQETSRAPPGAARVYQDDCAGEDCVHRWLDTYDARDPESLPSPASDLFEAELERTLGRLYRSWNPKPGDE